MAVSCSPASGEMKGSLSRPAAKAVFPCAAAAVLSPAALSVGFGGSGNLSPSGSERGYLKETFLRVESRIWFLFGFGRNKKVCLQHYDLVKFVPRQFCFELLQRK